jgi:[ribosomal protein S5]-alanine N-acetyltransferase
MPEVELRTERLHIRPLRREDRDEFIRVRALSAEFYGRWFPLENGTAADVFEAELKRAEARASIGTSFRFVGFRATGAMTVFVNLTDIVRGVFQNAYASWSVAADVQRQGYASEAVAALLDFAFREDGAALHRVQANIMPANDPSIRLAERLGFRWEGLALRYLQIAGKWEDHVMYARTREEHARRTS